MGKSNIKFMTDPQGVLNLWGIFNMKFGHMGSLGKLDGQTKTNQRLLVPTLFTTS